jgi:hypothetical protein
MLSRVAGVTTKVVQLAALPAFLVGVALGVTPKRAQLVPEAEDRREARLEADFFAAGAPPTRPLDLASAPAAVASVAPTGWFQVTVASLHEDSAAAAKVAARTQAVLVDAAAFLADPARAALRARLEDERSPAPLTPPEAAAFERAGLSSPIGVGAAKGARALALGPLVVVSDLKADFSELRPNPLAALLGAQADRTFSEGEPAGSRLATVDLVVEAAGPAAAERLAATCAAYLELPAELLLRAPWDPAGLSAAEARARATFLAAQRATREALERPQDLLYPIHDLTDSPEEVQGLLARAREALRARVQAVVSARPDVDEVVLGEYLRGLDDHGFGFPSGPGLELPARRRLAARLGGVPTAGLEPAPGALALSAAGRARSVGRRLDLGRLRFVRLACGLPALLGWLRAAGATSARVELTDAR